MIKIRIFTSLGNDLIMPDIFTRVFQTDKYQEHFQFVTDDSYTHAILVNTPKPKLTIPKENVLGLAYEPYDYLNIKEDFIKYAQKYIGVYYIGKRIKLPKPFTTNYSFMWHVEPIEDKIKTKQMSIIFSKKMELFGQRYRHKLVREILKTELPIDIYGHGCNFLSEKDKRIKGSFDKYEPYRGYQYSIAVENSDSEDYISEKFTNCIATNTIPVYYGARFVENYFGTKCYHRLTGNIEKDMKLITLLCDKEVHYDLTHAREQLVSGNAYFSEHIMKLFCNRKYVEDCRGRWSSSFYCEKLCNIHIPKNGSTTIRKHFEMEPIDFKLAEHKKNGRKLMVVIRNPMTRIVSIYAEIMKLRKDCQWRITKNAKFFNEKNKQKSFEMFLEFITDNYYDPHTLPQHHYIFEKGLRLQDIDYVVDFDNLPTKLKEISKSLGVDKKIEHHNRKIEYRINPELCRKKIEELYRKDFELYEQVVNPNKNRKRVDVFDNKE